MNSCAKKVGLSNGTNCVSTSLQLRYDRSSMFHELLRLEHEIYVNSRVLSSLVEAGAVSTEISRCKIARGNSALCYTHNCTRCTPKRTRDGTRRFKSLASDVASIVHSIFVNESLEIFLRFLLYIDLKCCIFDRVVQLYFVYNFKVIQQEGNSNILFNRSNKTCFSRRWQKRIWI